MNDSRDFNIRVRNSNQRRKSRMVAGQGATKFKKYLERSASIEMPQIQIEIKHEERKIPCNVHLIYYENCKCNHLSNRYLLGFGCETASGVKQQSRSPNAADMRINNNLFKAECV